MSYNLEGGGGFDTKNLTLVYNLKIGEYKYNEIVGGMGVKMVMYLMEEDKRGLTMAIGITR